MNRRIFPIIIVIGLILSCLAVPFVKSQNESFDFILIKQDGSVEPSFAPIQRVGNTYTFTNNIYKPIVVERGNITLEGAGHWLERSNNAPNITGIDSGVGINLTCSYVTVRNIYISNWNTGILGVYDNNGITNNSITGCYMGVKIYGNNYNIEWNYIANNQFKGINLRANHTSISHNEIAGEQDGINISYFDHIIMENNMSNTGYDITGLGTGVYIFRNNFFKTDPNRYVLPGGDAFWERGGEGNYWKSYNGTDENGDGIGDTPYSIGQVFESGSRIWDVDYRPLMKIVTVQKPLQPAPTPNSTPTLTPPQPTSSPNLTPSPSPTDNPSPAPTLLITASPTLSPSPTIPELPAGTILTLALVMAIIANQFKLKAKQTP